MKTSTIDAVKAHAIATYPHECCGIVVTKDGHEEYWPRTNTATKPEEYFRLDDLAYVDAEDGGYEVSAIVHSHPNAAAHPSMADRVACEALGLPWLIVSVGCDVATGEVFAHEVRCVEPEGFKAPLVGREFAHGVLDCYSLIRDYYAEHLGVALSDFAREDDWWRDAGAENVYLNNLAKDGWVEVAMKDLKPHDVILMAIRSRNGPNHGALYLGEGKILHHLYGRLSETTIYGGYYADTTVMVVRHPSQMEQSA